MHAPPPTRRRRLRAPSSPRCRNLFTDNHRCAAVGLNRSQTLRERVRGVWTPSRSGDLRFLKRVSLSWLERLLAMQ
jgi:hypothetical protein